MSDVTPVTQALDQLNIPYRTFKHAGPVTSLEQAARERGHLPDQVVRSIVFRVAKDEFIMVCIAGDRQVAWPALRKYLGQSRVSMASEPEVLTATGYERGAVSPFGLSRAMRILMDNSVWSQTEISIGSGVRGVTVIMQSVDLKRALSGAEFGNFGEADS